MNRRNFLKSISTAVSASIFLPRAADAFTWKKRSSGMWVVNPEYLTAPYEIHFWHYSNPDHLGVAFPVFTDRKRPAYNPKPEDILIPDNFPLRQNAAGEYVHPILWKKST